MTDLTANSIDLQARNQSIKRVLVGILFLALTGASRLSFGAPPLLTENKGKDTKAAETKEIERGRWSTEDATFPHRKNYRLLCVDGLLFLSMEGYGGGQSSSTAVHIIQVLDKTGKPKTCK